MENQRSPIVTFISVYRRIYKITSIVAAVFVVALVLGCLYELKHDDMEAVRSYVSSGGVVVISTVRFFLWTSILGIALRVLEAGSTAEKRSDLEKASRLLFGSFLLDVINKVFVFSVEPERTDWSTVSFPTYDGNVILFARGLMSYFFKLTAVLDGFLLPSTYGLASLMLALAVKEWAKRSRV